MESLIGQHAPEESIRIVVVDNDATKSSRFIVEEVSKTSRFPMEYYCEPRQGISFARNTAVAHARSEFVAFIDDDEIASTNWLAGLLMVARQWQSDAVLGPVLPSFPEGSPEWSKKCGFFNRPRHKTGDLVPVEEGRTGNALVRSKWLATAHPFDPAFAHTGGEDYDFFRRLNLAGGVIRWSDQAEVSETVPLDRQRLAWVVERALRGSSGYWRQRYGGRLTVQGLAQAILGFFVAVLSLLICIGLWVVSPGSSVRLLILASKGFGRCLALTKIKIESYGANRS